MIKGIDYIGGVNYIDVIVKHHPVGYAAGFLCKASGWKNGIKAARALAATGNCPTMRIHGMWKDNHDFTKADIDKAVKQAVKVAKLAAAYPDIKIYYSPWLEHRASQALFRKVKKACKAVLPKSVPVVCSGNPLPSGVNEFHHTTQKSRKYIFSYDGEDMLWPWAKDYQTYHRQAIHYYGWTARCNGLMNLSDNTPRPKRKAWLRRKDIKTIVREFNGS